MGACGPDPQAQGDETDTADVLIWDEMNGSWTASDQMMVDPRVVCGNLRCGQGVRRRGLEP